MDFYVTQVTNDYYNGAICKFISSYNRGSDLCSEKPGQKGEAWIPNEPCDRRGVLLVSADQANA